MVVGDVLWVYGIFDALYLKFVWAFLFLDLMVFDHILQENRFKAIDIK